MPSKKQAWQPDRWTFSVEEVAPGVWQAVADDHQGGTLQHVRHDPNEALDLVKEDAADITERRRVAGADPTE